MSELEKKRYYLFDSVRGICVLGMIAYHTLFDVMMYFGNSSAASLVPALDAVRDFGAAVFVILAGINFNFEKHFVRRGLLLNGAGIVITVITFFVMPDTPVIFGILTFMGCAGLLAGALRKPLMKLRPVLGSAVSFLLFALTFNIYYGFVGFFTVPVFEIPLSLYRNYLTAFFGFPFNGFASSDYFSFIPWFFMYLSGFFFWRAFGNRLEKGRLLYLRIPFVEKTGKYSFYVYLAHQPIVYGVVTLIYLLTVHKTA